jgi:hypothetical protein
VAKFSIAHAVYDSQDIRGLWLHQYRPTPATDLRSVKIVLVNMVADDKFSK